MPANTPWILGISASHNGAACLLHGDRIHSAIQEERLTRHKRQKLFLGRTSLAVQYCLQHAGITPADLAMVVGCVQGSSDGPQHDIALQPQLRVVHHRIPTRRIGHHHGHALSAFATSGFADAAVLVVDGAGSPARDLLPEEQRVVVGPADGLETISLYDANGTELTPREKHLCAPGTWWVKGDAGMGRFNSLGGIFSAVADLMFGDSLEAGKVMGLAPYGEADIPVEEFFTTDGPQFIFHDLVPRRFARAEPWPARQTEYKALAASAQRALEHGVLQLARRLRECSRSKNLCYAGGVALNSITNERLLREAGFENVYIMPAAEDSGPAIGAAYHGLWSLTGENSRRTLTHDSLGKCYSIGEIDAAIARTPVVRTYDTADVLGEVATRLAAGQIAGWFQGGSELGPRSLGQRSILCDPRRPDGQEILNRRVKHREAFRPFAPAILLERARDWFELDGVQADSPFMLRVCRFRADRRAAVPAVTHIDGTGRLQTVTREVNGRFHALIERFEQLTGVPILLNTSYNVMGEPIVETPEDALWDILYTGIDFAVLGDRLVVKDDAYRSPLELVPRLRAGRFSLNVPLAGGRVELALPDEGSAWFDVVTPWGELQQPVPLAHFPLLERIDGRASGRELHEQLVAAEPGAARTPEETIGALAFLRRSGVIEFGRG
jgi:carbamoyltransferase